MAKKYDVKKLAEAVQSGSVDAAVNFVFIPGDTRLEILGAEKFAAVLRRATELIPDEFAEYMPATLAGFVDLGILYLQDEQERFDRQEGAQFLSMAIDLAVCLDNELVLGMIVPPLAGYYNSIGQGERTIDMLEDLADEGYAVALCGLGVAFLEGNHVAFDLQRALEYLRQASDKGSEQATELITTVRELKANLANQPKEDPKAFLFPGCGTA